MPLKLRITVTNQGSQKLLPINVHIDPSHGFNTTIRWKT